MVALLQNALSHPAVLAALFAKLLAVTMWGTVLRRQIPDPLTSWLHSWLAVQALLTFTILMLSFCSALSRMTMWAFVLVMLASGIAAYVLHGVRLTRVSKKVLLVFAFIAGPLLFWLGRSMLLADYTLDSQSYGTVRIALWMNYGSVFVHMPTVMINIFTDEWNGELNGLFYGLIAGNIQGVMLGNTEVLLVAALAVVWLARRFGAGQSGSFLIGLLVATTPAYIGLASVTKGDLLLCVGVVMAIGMLERPTMRALFLACMWFALAAGAKISVAPAAALVMIISIGRHRRSVFTRDSLKFVAPAAVVSALFIFRFIANEVIFHNAFLRVEAEAAQPRLTTLFKNLSVVGERFIGFFPIDWAHGNTSYSDALSAGLGFAGWMAILGVALSWFQRKPGHGQLVLLSVTSLFLSAFLIPPRVWGFRYFLPFVSVIVVFWLVLLLHAVSTLRSPVRYAALFGLVAVAYLNLVMCVTPGPLRFSEMIKSAKGKTPIEVALLMWPFWIDEIAPIHHDLDSGPPKRIAVMNEMGGPLLLFVGSQAQNRLFLAKDRVGLTGAARKNGADYVAIVKARDSPAKQFDLPGYRWVVDNTTFLIAAKTH